MIFIMKNFIEYHRKIFYIKRKYNVQRLKHFVSVKQVTSFNKDILHIKCKFLLFVSFNKIKRCHKDL